MAKQGRCGKMEASVDGEHWERLEDASLHVQARELARLGYLPQTLDAFRQWQDLAEAERETMLAMVKIDQKIKDRVRMEKYLAVTLLGWNERGRGGQAGGLWVFWSCWNPFENIAHAKLIQRAMEAEGWRVVIERDITFCDNYFVTFMRPSGTPQAPYDEGTWSCESEAEAICEAAYRALNLAEDEYCEVLTADGKKWDEISGKGACETCGGGATWRPDPFIEEIEGEIVMRWLCDECWQDRKDEV